MTILFLVVAFLIAITVHEAAHAYMADKLGDPTARVQGRLTLNPIVHLDLYGTVLIPLFLMIIGSPFVFGWAKPVPVDPYNLKDPRKDSALISLAGPLANMILATIAALLIKFIGPVDFLYILVQYNVVLAVFNLLPIHPLDGGKVLVGILPTKESHDVNRFLTTYGNILLILAIFPIFGGVSIVSRVISPIINAILTLLI